MPNWLASELCMVVSFSLGAWKTFKVLKHGGTDYDLLKTWCLLGLLRVFEGYFEFLVSWIPFYWLSKCVGLALLLIPGGNFPSVVFENVVVWGMDNAHDVLNTLVVPNVIEFAVSLPWRVLLVLFPAMPPPPFRGAGLQAKKGVTGRGKGLAHRLQHLKVPTSPGSLMSPGVAATGRRDPPHRTGATAEVTPLGVGKRVRSKSPPPLPPRTPVKTPEKNQGNLNLTGPAGAAGNIGGDEARDIRGDRAANTTPEVSVHLFEGAASPGFVAATSPLRNEAAGTEDSSPEVGTRGSSRRKSFGEMVRSALTGNSKVRLRDHLFDLNTASPAPPLPTTPRETPQPDPPSPTATAAAAAISNPREEREREKQQRASDAAAAALPAIFDSGGSSERRARREVDAAPEGPVMSSIAARSRSSSATNGASANTTAVAAADSRAQRLAEWRKRRADQASAQHKDRSRKSRIATTTDSAAAAVAAPGPGPNPSLGPAVNGAAAAAPSGPGARRPNAVPSRRFRHVERFRSEMANNAGSSAKEPEDAGGTGDAPSRAPLPSSAGVGRSQ
eukprot:jgi/Undpi1/8302/HiC_scaffold_25.g10771.m1